MKSILLEAFGMLKDYKDIKNTETYVRKIRKGKRIEQLLEKRTLLL